MSRFTVRFGDEAADEVRAAARWYRQADPELERLFRTALRDCVGAIQRNPEAFPMALDRARRALIRTFPYGVYYMVVEENPVHTSLIVEHRLAEAYDGHLDGYPGEVRMGKSYSIAEARDNLARIVRESEAGPVTLTRRGRTVAILVSLDDFERLCGREASFWDRLVAFRKAENVERAGIEADVFDGLRDRDPGRTVQW